MFDNLKVDWWNLVIDCSMPILQKLNLLTIGLYNTPCLGQKLPIRSFSNLRTNADTKIKFTANERGTFQVLCKMLATFSHCC